LSMMESPPFQPLFEHNQIKGAKLGFFKTNTKIVININ